MPGPIFTGDTQTQGGPLEEGLSQEGTATAGWPITDFFQSRAEDSKHVPQCSGSRGTLLDLAIELGRSRRPRMRGPSRH